MNKKLTLLLLAALLMPTMALAGDDSFGVFVTELTGWLTGNLGFIVAIVALMGSLVIYAFTHKASVIIIGIVIAFLVGGGAGIARFFFEAGTTSFGDGGSAF